MGGQTNEHPGVGVLQRGRGNPGVLDRMPGRFHQQPMLRVDEAGLAGRDTEERCVEAGDVVDQPSPTSHDLSGNRGVGIVEFFRVPAVRGDLGDPVAALTERLPKGVCIGRSGKPCRVTDDRETGYVMHRFLS